MTKIQRQEDGMKNFIIRTPHKLVPINKHSDTDTDEESTAESESGMHKVKYFRNCVSPMTPKTLRQKQILVIHLQQSSVNSQLRTVQAKCEEKYNCFR